MKKIILPCIFFLMAATLLKAQNDTTNTVKKPEPLTIKKNLIKINLFALGLRNISLQYERKIAKKITIGLTAREMPDGLLPLEKSFRNSISDSSTKSQLDNFKVGNFAVIPEIRFYFSRRGAFHGFYIAPFASYAHYTSNLPYRYTDNGVDKSIQLAGSVNCLTGGLMFGAQWSLGKVVYLDLHLIGPNFGSCNGSITGSTSLSSDEQSALKSSLDNLKVPLATTSNTVNANGATLKFSGPWAGIRSGLCIGVRF
jgi:hypothetical protein